MMHAISPRWRLRINDTFNILNYIIVCPKQFFKHVFFIRVGYLGKKPLVGFVWFVCVSSDVVLNFHLL